jgi:hypothetical protein
MLASAGTEIEQDFWREFGPAIERVLVRDLWPYLFPLWKALLTSPFFWFAILGFAAIVIIAKWKKQNYQVPEVLKIWKTKLVRNADRKTIPDSASISAASVGPAFSAKESLGDQAKAKGQLAAKRARRAKLVSSTLPQAYRNLGGHLEKTETFKTDFPELSQQYANLQAGMYLLADGAAERPSAQGMAAKAKAAALAAKEMVQNRGFERRINQVLTKLGEAAFEKHGERIGPAEIVTPIAQARSEIAALDEDITRLSKPRQAQLSKQIQMLPVTSESINKEFQ